MCCMGPLRVWQETRQNGVCSPDDGHPPSPRSRSGRRFILKPARRSQTTSRIRCASVVTQGVRRCQDPNPPESRERVLSSGPHDATRTSGERTLADPPVERAAPCCGHPGRPARSLPIQPVHLRPLRGEVTPQSHAAWCADAAATPPAISNLTLPAAIGTGTNRSWRDSRSTICASCPSRMGTDRCDRPSRHHSARSPQSAGTAASAGGPT